MSCLCKMFCFIACVGSMTEENFVFTVMVRIWDILRLGSWEQEKDMR